MNIIGIVAEYNPLHNGHKYQIEQAKEKSNTDLSVAVMSGSFVQRGDIAVCDKWTRAKMAVMGGIDLVVELPVVFSCQSAEHFAKGAIKILEQIGVSNLAFGAETDNIDSLTSVADILNNPTDDYTKLFTSYMQNGNSFPNSRAKALKSLGYPDVLDFPNNLLAVEYLRKLNRNIKPIPIKRYGSLHDGIGSASYIRDLISKGKDISAFVPKSTVDLLNEALSNGIAPNFINSLDNVIISKLRTMTANELSQIRDVSEGLENRILKSANACTTISELADNIKTKRYTHSRIRRILINSLLGLTKDTEKFTPEYIRVLAMNDNGKKIIKNAKETSSIPIITKIADAPSSVMLDYEITATNLYSLTFNDINKRIGMYDKITSPIIIKN